MITTRLSPRPNEWEEGMPLATARLRAKDIKDKAREAPRRMFDLRVDRLRYTSEFQNGE